MLKNAENKNLRSNHTRIIAAIFTTLLLLILTGCSSAPNHTVPSPAITETTAPASGNENPNGQTRLTDAQEYNDDLEIHFLDVGQGLSILATCSGRTLLYDGGDRDYSSFVVSYLKEHGVSTIDYIIASHYDADHINGLVGAMNAFSIDSIIGPDYTHTSGVYQSFIKRTEELGKEVQHPQPGTQYPLGEATITILSPKTIVSNSNNNSIAVKIEHGGNTIIIMGDAEHAEEADIIASGIDLNCNVLVLGHHGSASSTTWDLLQKTVPEYAVISCGEHNSYGHPHTETMEKLESMEIDIFRTDHQGTIIMKSGASAMTWNTDPSTDYSAGSQDEVRTDEHPEIPDRPQTSAAEITVPAPAAATSESERLPESVSPSETAAISEPSDETDSISQMVWQSATGSKYHAIPNCGNMNPDKATEITLDYAESIGLGRCKNCWR